MVQSHENLALKKLSNILYNNTKRGFFKMQSSDNSSGANPALDPTKLQVKELKAELRARGLLLKGKKAVLIARLQEALATAPAPSSATTPAILVKTPEQIKQELRFASIVELRNLLSELVAKANIPSLVFEDIYDAIHVLRKYTGEDEISRDMINKTLVKAADLAVINAVLDEGVKRGFFQESSDMFSVVEKEFNPESLKGRRKLLMEKVLFNLDGTTFSKPPINKLFKGKKGKTTDGILNMYAITSSKMDKHRELLSELLSLNTEHYGESEKEELNKAIDYLNRFLWQNFQKGDIVRVNNKVGRILTVNHDTGELEIKVEGKTIKSEKSLVKLISRRKSDSIPRESLLIVKESDILSSSQLSLSSVVTFKYKDSVYKGTIVNKVIKCDVDENNQLKERIVGALLLENNVYDDITANMVTIDSTFYKNLQAKVITNFINKFTTNPISYHVAITELLWPLFKHGPKSNKNLCHLKNFKSLNKFNGSLNYQLISDSLKLFEESATDDEDMTMPRFLWFCFKQLDWTYDPLFSEWTTNDEANYSNFGIIKHFIILLILFLKDQYTVIDDSQIDMTLTQFLLNTLPKHKVKIKVEIAKLKQLERKFLHVNTHLQKIDNLSKLQIQTLLSQVTGLFYDTPPPKKGNFAQTEGMRRDPLPWTAHITVNPNQSKEKLYALLKAKLKQIPKLATLIELATPDLWNDQKISPEITDENADAEKTKYINRIHELITNKELSLTNIQHLIQDKTLNCKILYSIKNYALDNNYLNSLLIDDKLITDVIIDPKAKNKLLSAKSIQEYEFFNKNVKKFLDVMQSYNPETKTSLQILGDFLSNYYISPLNNKDRAKKIYDNIKFKLIELANICYGKDSGKQFLAALKDYNENKYDSPIPVLNIFISRYRINNELFLEGKFNEIIDIFESDNLNYEEGVNNLLKEIKKSHRHNLSIELSTAISLFVNPVFNRINKSNILAKISTSSKQVSKFVELMSNCNNFICGDDNPNFCENIDCDICFNNVCTKKHISSKETQPLNIVKLNNLILPVYNTCSKTKAACKGKARDIGILFFLEPTNVERLKIINSILITIGIVSPTSTQAIDIASKLNKKESPELIKKLTRYFRLKRNVLSTVIETRLNAQLRREKQNIAVKELHKDIIVILETLGINYSKFLENIEIKNNEIYIYFNPQIIDKKINNELDFLKNINHKTLLIDLTSEQLFIIIQELYHYLYNKIREYVDITPTKKDHYEFLYYQSKKFLKNYITQSIKTYMKDGYIKDFLNKISLLCLLFVINKVVDNYIYKISFEKDDSLKNKLITTLAKLNIDYIESATDPLDENSSSTVTFTVNIKNQNKIQKIIGAIPIEVTKTYKYTSFMSTYLPTINNIQAGRVFLNKIFSNELDGNTAAQMDLEDIFPLQFFTTDQDEKNKIQEKIIGRQTDYSDNWLLPYLKNIKVTINQRALKVGSADLANKLSTDFIGGETTKKYSSLLTILPETLKSFETCKQIPLDRLILYSPTSYLIKDTQGTLEEWPVTILKHLPKEEVLVAIEKNIKDNPEWIVKETNDERFSEGSNNRKYYENVRTKERTWIRPTTMNWRRFGPESNIPVQKIHKSQLKLILDENLQKINIYCFDIFTLFEALQNDHPIKNILSPDFIREILTLDMDGLLARNKLINDKLNSKTTDISQMGRSVEEGIFERFANTVDRPTILTMLKENKYDTIKTIKELLAKTEQEEIITKQVEVPQVVVAPQVSKWAGLLPNVRRRNEGAEKLWRQRITRYIEKPSKKDTDGYWDGEDWHPNTGWQDEAITIDPPPALDRKILSKYDFIVKNIVDLNIIKTTVTDKFIKPKEYKSSGATLYNINEVLKLVGLRYLPVVKLSTPSSIIKMLYVFSKDDSRVGDDLIALRALNKALKEVTNLPDIDPTKQVQLQKIHKDKEQLETLLKTFLDKIRLKGGDIKKREILAKDERGNFINLTSSEEITGARDNLYNLIDKLFTEYAKYIDASSKAGINIITPEVQEKIISYIEYLSGKIPKGSLEMSLSRSSSESSASSFSSASGSFKFSFGDFSFGDTCNHCNNNRLKHRLVKIIRKFGFGDNIMKKSYCLKCLQDSNCNV